MILLWILLGVLILLFLLSTLSLRVVLEYHEEITVTLSAFFLNFRLFPKKKKKIRLSDYSKKAMEKRKGREQKKAKKQKKSKQETKPAPLPHEKKGIVERLNQIHEILTVFLTKTFGHLSIRASRIRIAVATGDAASTALLFGAVNGALTLLLETLDRFGALKIKPKDELAVYPDYLAEKTTADIRFVFSLRVWHILDILLKTFFTYIKSKKQKSKP